MSDAEQASTDSGASFHCCATHKLNSWESGRNCWANKYLEVRAEAEQSGTCCVHDVSVGLRSATGLHADAHILPFGQSALGGEVAGNVWRNYRLIWERRKDTRHYNQGCGYCDTRAKTYASLITILIIY